MDPTLGTILLIAFPILLILAIAAYGRYSADAD